MVQWNCISLINYTKGKLKFPKKPIDERIFKYKGKWTYIKNIGQSLRDYNSHDGYKQHYIISQLKNDIQSFNNDFHRYIYLNQYFMTIRNSLKGTWNDASEFCKS